MFMSVLYSLGINRSHEYQGERLVGPVVVVVVVVAAVGDSNGGEVDICRW